MAFVAPFLRSAWREDNGHGRTELSRRSLCQGSHKLRRGLCGGSGWKPSKLVPSLGMWPFGCFRQIGQARFLPVWFTCVASDWLQGGGGEPKMSDIDSSFRLRTAGPYLYSLFADRGFRISPWNLDFRKVTVGVVIFSCWNKKSLKSTGVKLFVIGLFIFI